MATRMRQRDGERQRAIRNLLGSSSIAAIGTGNERKKGWVKAANFFLSASFPPSGFQRKHPGEAGAQDLDGRDDARRHPRRH